MIRSLDTRNRYFKEKFEEIGKTLDVLSNKNSQCVEEVKTFDNMDYSSVYLSSSSSSSTSSSSSFKLNNLFLLNYIGEGSFNIIYNFANNKYSDIVFRQLKSDKNYILSQVSQSIYFTLFFSHCVFKGLIPNFLLSYGPYFCKGLPSLLQERGNFDLSQFMANMRTDGDIHSLNTIVMQIVCAMMFMNMCGLGHYDLKPENIIIKKIPKTKLIYRFPNVDNDIEIVTEYLALITDFDFVKVLSTKSSKLQLFTGCYYVLTMNNENFDKPSVENMHYRNQDLITFLNITLKFITHYTKIPNIIDKTYPISIIYEYIKNLELKNYNVKNVLEKLPSLCNLINSNTSSQDIISEYVYSPTIDDIKSAGYSMWKYVGKNISNLNLNFDDNYIEYMNRGTRFAGYDAIYNNVCDYGIQQIYQYNSDKNIFDISGKDTIEEYYNANNRDNEELNLKDYKSFSSSLWGHLHSVSRILKSYYEGDYLEHF